MIAEHFDHPKVRFWTGVLLGIPATCFAVPWAFIGFGGGLLLIGGPGTVEGLSMILGSALGSAGIVGAWLRLASSEAMLRQSPTRRRLVLLLLTSGILASLILCVFFWFLPARFAAVTSVFAAVLGIFLIWTSVPVRPNSTLHRTRA